jgi:hypothetical protein
MKLKLHRCDNEWVRCSGHPCWNVQQALDEAGIEYELVVHPSFPRSERKEYIALCGSKLLPAIELEDGTVIREESKELIAMIEAGRFGAVRA